MRNFTFQILGVLAEILDVSAEVWKLRTTGKFSVPDAQFIRSIFFKVF